MHPIALRTAFSLNTAYAAGCAATLCLRLDAKLMGAERDTPV